MVNPEQTDTTPLSIVQPGRAADQEKAIPKAKRWLTAARWIWRASVLLVIGLFVVSVPARYGQLSSLSFPVYSQADIFRASDPRAIRVILGQIGMSPEFYAGYTIAMEMAFAIVFCAVAVMIVRQKSHPWLIMGVSLTLVLYGTSAIPTMDALARVDQRIVLPVRFVNTLSWTLFGLFYFIFPDGRFVPRWIWLPAIVFVVWQTSWSIFPGATFDPLTWSPAVALAVWLAWFISGVGSQVYRYLKVSTPVQRQQTKWALFGLSVAVAGVPIVTLPGVMMATSGLPAQPVYQLIRVPLVYLFVMLVPVFIGISILRYRLWDIDLLINRTLVYVPLTAIVAGLYTTSITFSQRVFVAVTGERSDAAIVMTTLVVASTFVPIRNSLQAVVDKRFKEMPDPARRLGAFGSQVRSVVQVIDVQQITKRMLDEAMAAFDAQCGMVRVANGDSEEVVCASGRWEECETQITVPMLHRGTLLGKVSLGPRGTGGDYSEADRKVLAEAADVVASAIYVARQLS